MNLSHVLKHLAGTGSVQETARALDLPPGEISDSLRKLAESLPLEPAAPRTPFRETEGYRDLERNAQGLGVIIAVSGEGGMETIRLSSQFLPSRVLDVFRTRMLKVPGSDTVRIEVCPEQA